MSSSNPRTALRIRPVQSAPFEGAVPVSGCMIHSSEVSFNLVRARRAPLPRGGSGQRLDLDGQHGREVRDDGTPVIAAVVRGIDLPAGGAEVDAARVER